MLVPRKISLEPPLYYAETIGRRPVAWLVLAYSVLSVAIPALLLLLWYLAHELAAVFVLQIPGMIFLGSIICWLILGVVAQNEFQRRNFTLGGISVTYPLTAVPIVFIVLIFGGPSAMLALFALIVGVGINTRLSIDWFQIMKEEAVQRLGCGRAHHKAIEADE